MIGCQLKNEKTKKEKKKKKEREREREKTRRKKEKRKEKKWSAINLEKEKENHLEKSKINFELINRASILDIAPWTLSAPTVRFDLIKKQKQKHD